MDGSGEDRLEPGTDGDGMGSSTGEGMGTEEGSGEGGGLEWAGNQLSNGRWG